MNRPADQLKPSQARDAAVPSPPPILKRPASPHPGTNPTALAELRNAAATYDFLRRRGDPAQFWEMLRLARNHRVIVAPPEGGPAAAPTPEVEASIVGELDLIRRHHSPLVRDLRRFLKQVQGLPEPAERLEMALAFLLASTREHQAVARWVAEPDKHCGKAAEKLRSLAAITDPYRDALRPWVLETTGASEPTASPPAAPARTVPNPSALDPETLGRFRLAIRCREVLTGVYLEAELWETLLLATSQPEPTRAALDRIEQDVEAERLDEVEAKAEVLFKKVAALRSENESWVHALRGAFPPPGSAPADPDLQEIALGLMVIAPGIAAWTGLWSKDPQSYSQEAAELWTRSIVRAKICRMALTSAGS